MILLSENVKHLTWWWPCSCPCSKYWGVSFHSFSAECHWTLCSWITGQSVYTVTLPVSYFLYCEKHKYDKKLLLERKTLPITLNSPRHFSIEHICPIWIASTHQTTANLPGRRGFQCQPHRWTFLLCQKQHSILPSTFQPLNRAKVHGWSEVWCWVMKTTWNSSI